MPRISKRFVDAIDTETGKRQLFWDDGLAGFGLKVTATGAKIYLVKYRVGAAQRWFKIGEHGEPFKTYDEDEYGERRERLTTLTPDLARKAAADLLADVRKGLDPQSAKKEVRKALTVANLIDAYLEEGPATKPNKRASTWEIDASNLNRHIRPLLGRKVANLVSKADALRAIKDISDGKTAKEEASDKRRGKVIVTGGPGTARRTQTTAAAMFAWGVEHDKIKANPFAKLKRTAPPVRERFLSAEEAGRLSDAIRDMEADGTLSKTFGDAIRLLMLTGARKTEILGLQWSEVDFERRLILLPPERTKAGGKTGERRVSLSPPALSILSERQAAAKAAAKDSKAAVSPYVFPSSRNDGHAIGLRKAFVKVLEQAKLEGVRPHDLRHSFASFAVADGASLFLVSKLLGHANARTTERYAHLSADPLDEAVTKIGERLTARHGQAEAPPAEPDAPAKTGKVVPLKGKRR